MTFQSKYPFLKVWIKPSSYKFDSVGNRYFDPGKFVEFENGFLKTDDPEVIEGLKKNQYYGIDFWAIDEGKVEINPEGQKVLEAKKVAEETTLTDCPHCGKTFQNKAGLMSHIAYMHKNV